VTGVVAITLGFCPARVLEAGMGHFYTTATPGLIETHYFLDQHYPVDRKTNRNRLLDLCNRYGMKWVDSGRDRGMCAGANFLLSQLPKDTRYILGYDPDAVATIPGWDAAMVAVLEADSELAWVSLTPACIADNIESGRLQGAIRARAHNRVFVPERVDMFSITGLRADFIRDIGGFSSPFGYYGQVEMPLWAGAKQRGMSYGYLLDYPEGAGPGNLHDLEYVEWKHAHIAGDTRSFGEWLGGER